MILERNEAPFTAFVWRAGRRHPLTFRNSKEIDVTAINERGHVIGDAGYRYSPSVLWKGGRAIRLGISAHAINDRDQVVGTLVAGRTKTGTVIFHAALWQNGRVRDLGTLGGMNSSAVGINNRGQIIGVSDRPRGAKHAFLWENGRMTDLGSFFGLPSRPNAINEAGDVVGSVHLSIGVEVVAVVWRHGRLINLGRFGDRRAEAFAINSKGDFLVVTIGDDGYPKRTLLVRGGKAIDLGSIGGGGTQGHDLNDRDQITGTSYTRDQFPRNFLWEDGRMRLLPGLVPEGPASLNNRGSLIAQISVGGKVHAVLLTRSR